MGQASSSANEVTPELRDVQSLAASTGALPFLQKAFSHMADPQTKSVPISSLQKCFGLTLENLEYDKGLVFEEFPQLFSHLGSAIVDLCFVAENDGVTWIEFLKGYTKCCARTVAATSFSNLFRVFSKTYSNAGLPLDLKFELYDDDWKVSGSLYPRELLILLWICWILSWDSRKSRLSAGKKRSDCSIPDVSHLVFSAIESCSDGSDGLDFWDSAVSNMDIQLPTAKAYAWAMNTVPKLADCLGQFVHSRLCHLPTNEDKLESSCSSSQSNSSSAMCETTLLTSGRAWAISLTLTGSIYEEISESCFPCNVDETRENLLYRSSVHGKGLNRFWANIEGYNGPMLLLISACDDKSNTKKWIVGALTHQGFENKELFYGTSGNLYALSPVFHALSSTAGKEKNFVYSHLHPTGRVYDPHPKPVGIAFGGSMGNERIFIDEDFARITIRHHAIDKTYQHGALFPNQGFLPHEASILETEVWGLGGRKAMDIQTSYRKREQLFTDQRRKVDLKTFANWEDSPEKMMMDMMSNPNAVRKEDR